MSTVLPKTKTLDSLVNPTSLATYINYPQEHYAYPNFDYVMTEAYDWIIEQPP